jgi:ABC-2 type transport system permease protein
MLTTTMPLVSLALWSAVAADGPIGGFDQKGFGVYFLATLIVRQVTGSWLVWALNTEIRTGELSQRLLKPLHPLVGFSAENLSAVPLRAAIAIPLALVALWVVGPTTATVTPLQLAVVILSLVGAWAVNFFTMALMGSLAFFIESATAVFEVWLVAFGVLSGYLVPLSLLPGWAQRLSYALPFRYTLGFPVEAMLGLLTPGALLRELLVQWVYVVVSAAGALLVWRAGLRRYAAFGG